MWNPFFQGVPLWHPTNMEDLHLYLLLLLFAWSIFNNYFLHKLKNLPPTPFSALRIIFCLRFFKQPIHRTLSQIAACHGPVLLLRFGCRRVLLVSSSEAAEDLFTKNDLVFARRPRMLVGEIFGRNYTNLAWAPHCAHWQHLRRVSFFEVIPFYRQLGEHESLADDVKLLLGRIFQTKNKKIELKSMLLEHVFEVMLTMFTGKRYWEKKPTAEAETMKSNLLECVTGSFKMTTGESDIGYFMPPLKQLGLTSGFEQRCQSLQDKGDSLMKRIIEELRTNMHEWSEGSVKKGKKAIEFLLDRQKEDPKIYKDETIRDLVLVLMSAGTDTSAGILEWAFSLLLNNPEALQKAQNEIDGYVGNDRFLDPLDIEHLSYLNFIVKETLRLYPIAPLLVPHVSSKECMVGGYNVPKDTMLMVNVWAIQNDDKTWDEPGKFKPERFEKHAGERDAFKLFPFGYARRSCPGKHMALRVITLALGSLIHCFDWDRVSEKMVDMTEQTGIALLKDTPLVAICRPRPSMVNLLSQI